MRWASLQEKLSEPTCADSPKCLRSMLMVMDDFRYADPDVQQSKSGNDAARDAGTHQSTDRGKGQQIMILVPVSRPRKQEYEQPHIEAKHHQDDDGYPLQPQRSRGFDQFSVFGNAEASGFKLSGENKSCCDIFL